MNSPIHKFTIQEASAQLEALIDSTIAGELVAIEIYDGFAVQLIPMDESPREAVADGQL